MSRQTLNTVELEDTYRWLAEAIDGVGSEKEPLFLAKLAMILANELGDVEFVRNAIADAARDL